MTEHSASDATYSLRDKETNLHQHVDNGIAYSRFHLFPLYVSCGPYILKKREEMYLVLNMLFLKVGA